MKALSLEHLQRCKKCVALGSEHVPAEGNPTAQVMLIGFSPGIQDVEAGSPFQGPTGDVIDYFLDEAGLSREQVYMTNVLKCKLPRGKKASPEELANCYSSWLLKELKALNPPIVVLVGKDACEAMTKGTIPFGHGLVTKTEKRAYLTVGSPIFYINRGDVETFVNAGKKLKELYEEV